MQFEHDKDSIEHVLTEAAEKFGEHIAELHFGERYIDWSVTGGQTFGTTYVFDFSFDNNGTRATVQMQLVGLDNFALTPAVEYAQYTGDGYVTVYYTNGDSDEMQQTEFESNAQYEGCEIYGNMQ